MMEKAMRGFCDDLIEKLGPVAMDSHLVRNCVHCIEAGFVSREDGLIQLARVLAEFNKSLMDNAINLSMVAASQPIFIPSDIHAAGSSEVKP